MVANVWLPSRGTLIISGPNAGGKTVSLKLTGLCVLMARVGLLPRKRGSNLPWFDEVLTDVGDDQSLERICRPSRHTSTTCDASWRQFGRERWSSSDEIAVGTDPEQGAALAQAVPETRARSGARPCW